MKYFIATGTEPDVLMQQVIKLIRDGWIPQGGVAAYMERNQQMFAQALVKDEDINITAKDVTEAFEKAKGKLRIK